MTSKYKDGAFSSGPYSVGFDINTDTGEGCIAVLDTRSMQVVAFEKLDPSIIDIEHEVVTDEILKLMPRNP